MSTSKDKKVKKSKKVENTIKLVFPENLIKSLNIMYEKQNHELMKVISDEKMINYQDLLQFIYDQDYVIIPLDK
jgi:hypothetical protein